MDFSEDWKSLFPISLNTFTSPLLLSGPNAKLTLGPLLFNPILNSLTSLVSSPLSLISPLPRLSLSRFLTTSSFIQLSTSAAIASGVGSLPLNDAASFLSRNRLCLLHCPLNNSVIAFFPTGVNSNQVSFSVLSVRNGCLGIQVDESGSIYTADARSSHPILKVVVNPVADMGFQDENSGLACNGSVAVGYLLAHTMYSVHWFGIRIKALGSNLERPVLAYLGNKVFKSCSVVDACWSPHLAEETVVLLESGELFLFDMERCLKNSGSNASFKETRLRVTWNDWVSSQLPAYKWLAIDFSWHPRILIVARTDAVFLIDLRDDESTVSCLMKIDMLGRYSSVKNDRFLAFSKAGSDGFYFTLASTGILILGDVRKPMMPLLQWDHGLDEPSYINVFRLSELRSHSQDDAYKWASECGFGIIIGSFWNGEFSLFCYGPPLPAPRGSLASKISKFCKPLYAWELPSKVALSGRDCRCGSCLVKEESMKDTLPEWIDWQQKKDLVLGFGILNKNLSALLSEADEFGGFTLVRLMSSGQLESQRYCASWELAKKVEAHQKSSFCFEENFLYSMGDEKYKFPRRFKYLELDYLHGYLNGNLAEVLDSNIEKPLKGTQKWKSFNIDSHEILCEKLKAYRFSRLRASHSASVIFNDISLPTSVHEVAFRKMWMNLPTDLLQLAFSSYSEFLEVLLDQKKVSLEFLVVPDLPQLAPFFLRKSSCRSNKWSNKVQRGNALVGPVLPLPILLLLHKFQRGRPNSEEADGFSVELELGLYCKEVMQGARKMAVPDSCSEMYDNDVVNLGDDKEEILADSEEPKPFVLFRPVAFKFPTVDGMMGNLGFNKDETFTTLICKVPEKELPDSQKEILGEELFDHLSPMGLKFDDCVIDFLPKELKALNLLKRQYSRWEKAFD